MAAFTDARANKVAADLSLAGEWEIDESKDHRAYVYLHQPDREATSDDERVPSTAYDVLEEIYELGEEEDGTSVVVELDKLLVKNRPVLRREWKFHLQPSARDLRKVVRALTESQLVEERVGMMKVLFDNKLLRNPDQDEGNFARVVVYFYGTRAKAQQLLDEIVRVTAGIGAVKAVPRYSARATPVVYWTQSSGDIKTNYRVLLDFYEQAQTLFTEDFTSFAGRSNRLTGPVVSDAQIRARLQRGETHEQVARALLALY